MAEAIASVVVERIASILEEQIGLIIVGDGLKEKGRWIVRELRVMVSYKESVDAQHQVPDDLMERTRSVIRKAEDLIQTYTRMASQRRTAAIYQKPFYGRNMKNLGRKLNNIMEEIIQVRQGWKDVVDVENTISRDEDNDDNSPSYAAMAKLDSALKVKHRLVLPLCDDIKWVRDELAPLHEFLKQIDHAPVPIPLGERQKVWIDELRAIFQFVVSFECFLEAAIANKSCLSLFAYIFNAPKLRSLVYEIQCKIIQLFRRYYVYGLGQIRVDNRSIVPRIRMSIPIRIVSRLNQDAASTLTTEAANTRMRLMPRGPIEPLELKMMKGLLELKMMKGLLADTRSSMMDLDEREKVWLSQVEEVSVELEAALSKQPSIANQVVHLPRCDSASLHLNHINSQILGLAARKMTYGILRGYCDSFEDQQYNHLVLQEIESNLLEKSTISKAVKPNIGADALVEIAIGVGSKVLRSVRESLLRRQVESLRKDLKLMEALLQDASGMRKLDERLKAWLVKMRSVAHLANDVVKLDTKKFLGRYKGARRIEEIQNQILILSKWKHTYDIGDVRFASIWSHNLEETNIEIDEQPFSGENRLIVRERDLFKASVMDILQVDEGDSPREDILIALTGHVSGRMIEPDNKISKAWNDLDGKTKSWVEEMLKIHEDAITTGNQLDDKTRQLSEIRIAYGIQIRQKLPPLIVDQIKEKLVMDQRLFVPIIGMENAHKRVLRDLINGDDAVRHRFQYHVWVRVPEGDEEITPVSISVDITNQIRMLQTTRLASSSSNPTDEISLQEILMGNNCLIVLDEVRTPRAWDILYQVFQPISTSSTSTRGKIILITNRQTSSFSSSTSSDNIFHSPIMLRETLPPIGENVPSYLRQCIYYFLLFPEGFQVSTRRLIVLWVAEGLVHTKENNNGPSVEHVAEEYLNELINLDLVRPTKRKSNGKVKACQLNSSRRDTWLKKAKEAKFFEDVNGSITRLVDNHGTNDSSFIQVQSHVPSSLKNYKNVISFLSFETKEGRQPGEEIGDFLNKCILVGCFLWLRVLDLERVFRPKLPKVITRLTHLRYLGLRWTYLEYLPKYVCKLPNLQVLDMKHTYIKILPKSIWRMQYLRHLYLSETYRTKFDKRPSSWISLDELQTLWGAFIDEKSSIKNGLDTLHNIRKLGLSCRSTSSTPGLMSEQLLSVSEWISKLKFLDTLRLRSLDEHGRASDLHLNSLEANRNLSTVYLLGKLQPSVVLTFPENLIEVTLSGSDLNKDPMEHLGKLKKLLVLRLLSNSVTLTTMSCSRSSFPKLKVFKIWQLPNLENWEAEGGALPSLEYLEIRRCNNLRVIPQALQHIDTLREFELTRMPQRFIDDCKTIQPELWSKIEGILKVNSE